MILALETSSESGSVALAHKGTVLVELHFRLPNSHSRLLAPAIEQALRFAQIALAEVDAVAVSAGPGSYTGLRIGASTAKGICFAAGKPLLAVSTLDVLAHQARPMAELLGQPLICPMLDARRMEVYTALYDASAKPLRSAKAVVPDGDFLSDTGQEARILLLGSGAAKLRALLEPCGRFGWLADQVPTAGAVAILAAGTSPVDLASFEPDYLKPFMGQAVSSL